MKKRLLALVLAMQMLFGAAMPAVSAAEPDVSSATVMKTYYVSPEGSDGNSGESPETAFATLEKAQEAVRSQNGNMTGDIVVYLMDGTWELDDTLTFGKEDSGTNGYDVRYVAYEGATPMISGGKALVTDWKKDKTLDNGNTIYKTALTRDSKLRALYVNGERRYMAHTEQAIPAQGSWGSYIIGDTPEVADFQWEEIYSENFEACDLSASDAKVKPYAKSGDTSKAVLNIAEEDGNKALQIAHTANEDCGFQIPEVTYQNAMITYRVQFAADHKFTQEWEALHMHGANKFLDDSGRTAWAGIKFAPHLNQTYFQYGASGGSQGDEASGMLNVTAFTAQPDVWYQVKMMVTADGYYYTKIWKDDSEEPSDWSRRETFNNLNNQDKFLRIYAYKNNDGSNMDIRVDGIRIQSGTLISEGGETALPEWAWNTGSKFDGILYNQSDLPEITRNVTDVEIENQQTWNKNTVCVREIEPGTDGKWILKLQQPYGAIAQTPGWGVGLKGSGNHVVHNAYELLDQPGEFYFDRTEQMLYYIPAAGEDLSTAEVVVPQLETVVEFRGTPEVTGEMDKAGADNKTITGQVKNIVFDGLTIAHSDWNLQKVGDSYGKSTVQAGTTYTAFASGNWHADMYRNLDTIPGAVEMEFARNIRFMNGEIKLTGAEGVLMSNDVDGCQVIGNFFYQTGGGGVVMGNPQHTYENDSLEPDTYYYHYISGDGKPEVSADGAAASHEKYQNGLERAPRDVKVSNNYLLENCRLFPSHCPITSFYTQRMEVSNNFIKDAAYSGMSIGWGWGNFDGTTAKDNQWGAENHQGYGILPGIPTEVCRDNQIVNNRIDGTMKILADGGLIYTLGKQNNTLISGNYGTDSEQGLYQDEGSAYFQTIRDNVMTNVRGNAIAAGAYGRKHDLHYDNNYSNKNAVAVAPQYQVTSENFHCIEDSTWPKEASDIIQTSGLTAEYRAKFADHLEDAYGSVQDALLPQNAALRSGEQLLLNAWLRAEDEIWLAPAHTTEFVDGQNMVKVSGDAAAVDTFCLNGTYKLYVKQNGAYSEASSATVQVTAEDEKTVSFDANGGSGTMSAVKVSSGVEYVLPECTFVAPAGMQFKNWRINDVDKAVGDTVQITEDTIVMAVWEKKGEGGSTGGGGSSVSRYTITVTQSTGGKITPATCQVNKGADKAFTITANEGYKIADVLVDGKSVGAVSSYTFEDVKSSHTITAEFKKTGETGNVSGFTDVKAGDWFAESVQYVVDNKLMNGVAADKFAPNSDTTRGMIVTILYREAGSPAVESDDASWWSDARIWAMEQKISDGTNMEGTITREQLTTMLYRYAGSPAVTGEITGFSDADKISDWASDAMLWAAENGILNGSNGKLNPQGNASRAEVATMLMRFCELTK